MLTCLGRARRGEGPLDVELIPRVACSGLTIRDPFFFQGQALNTQKLQEDWWVATPAQTVSQTNWRHSKWFDYNTTTKKPFLNQPTLSLFPPGWFSARLIPWQTFYKHHFCLCLREVGLPEHQVQPSKTHLIRPLTTLHRGDIKKLCFFWTLPFYPDKTNQQLTFQRNRVRKQLLPSLKYFLNPQLDKALFQLSEILASEHKFLEHFITKFWSQNIESSVLYMKPSLLLALPPPVSRRVVKKVFQYKTNRRTSFLRVESLLVRTREQAFLVPKTGNKNKQVNSVSYVLFYPKQGAIVEKG